MYRDFRIEVNRDWEVILIELDGNTVLDQVIVDTLSILEPATMSLLALGGLAMLRRKRQK